MRILFLLLTYLAWFNLGFASTSNQIDLSAQIQLTKGGFVFNRNTKTYNTSLNLTNKNLSIQGPLTLVFSGLPANVTLANATGTDSTGNPEITIPLSQGSISPNQVISNILVKFNNPEKLPISYSVSIYGFAYSTQASLVTANPVLQRGYTPDVAGANLTETILTPTSVSASTFGRIFSLPVEGSIYAQPLYVPNLNINGGVHNVVFVATMKDYVYAFDADTPGAPLWEVNYAGAISGATPVPITNYIGSNSYNIAGSVGIESTPVIDPSNNTLYFVTNTLENNNIVFRLHAVDITSGAEKFGGSVVINATTTFAGNSLSFDPSVENQRTSLALANGQIIVAFASHEDAFLYYGWVMSYNATSLALTGVFNPAPSNYAAGVWQSGRPPVVDSAGNVYLYTGNGISLGNSQQPTADGVNNFAESVLKLDPVSLNVIDYFTPANYAFLDEHDLDFSASGPTLIPGSNILIGGGKLGAFYLLNTQNLGQLQSNDAGAVQLVTVTGGNEILGGPVIWSRSSAAGGPLIYDWGHNDSLKAFSYSAQNNLSNNPVDTFSGGPGPDSRGILAVSANGDANGIVWASVNTQQGAGHTIVPGELIALNASNLSQQLWNSTQVSARDDLGLWAKNVPPVVANGKVYMATQSNQLVVYGFLPTRGTPTVTAWPPLKAAMGGVENFLVSALSASGVQVTAAWSVSGLPSGATGEFQIDAYNRTLLHVTLDGTTPQGSYRLFLTANVGGNLTTQAVLMDVVSSTAGTATAATADSQMSTNLATMAIDRIVSTFWETDTIASPSYPHNIVLNLGSVQPVAGLFYLPRQDGCVDGTALQYEIYLSADNVNWYTQTAGGSFDYGGAWRSYACDGQTYPQSQKISFPVTNAQYINLNLLNAEMYGTPWASAAEVWAFVANGNQPQVTLASSAPAIIPGQAVTFTATINGNSPTGTLQFLNNGVLIDSPVAVVSGVATLTTTSLINLGVDNITANYWGDANNYSSSSAALSLTVLDPAAITVSSSADPTVADQSVTFTATVTGANPTGTVQFYLNGAALDAPVTLSNGTASLTTNDLTTAGTDSVTASYSGDANNTATTSSTSLTETVTPPTKQVPALPWVYQLIMALCLCVLTILIKNLATIQRIS